MGVVSCDTTISNRCTMATIVVPTLSGSGWLTGVAERADALLSYFLVSDYTQSNTHKGGIASLPYIIQRETRNIFSLKEDISGALGTLLRRYFDNTDSRSARYNLTLSVTISDGGKRYSLGKLIDVVNNRVHRVTNLGDT